MTSGERKLCEYKAGMTGHFFTSLFECMCYADRENLGKLGTAFPEEVEAYYRYHNEDGYWQKLEAEWNAKKSEMFKGLK
jgi:hypothetical protein